tara:strand:+ start:921 stop:1034 length:114 start_codon:yes stop_codon:yes gene_type:complete
MKIFRRKQSPKKSNKERIKPDNENDENDENNDESREE